MSAVSAHPTVSVVIPLYNAQDVIRETIHTVLNQTWKDYEIVVVDDGSHDGSGHIIKEFGERIRYVRQENGGVAKARNRGIAESKGQYIALLDHDDLWDPAKIEKQIAVLDTRPDVGMVISSVVHIDQNRKRLGVADSPYKPDDEFATLFVKDYQPTPSAAMIRRIVLQQVGGFDERFHSAGLDDHEFWTRIADVTEIANIDEPLTFHRNRETKPREIALRHRGVLIDILMKRYGHDARKRRYLLRQKAEYLADMGKYAVGQGDFQQGRGYFLAGLGISLLVSWNGKALWRCLSRLVRSYI